MIFIEFIIHYPPMKDFIFYFFYIQMKKILFLFGLITTTVCLSACGSKNFNMSFEEALEIANHSALQDILAENDNDNFEQTFDISGNLDTEGTKVDANISSNSKQNTSNKTSESSTKFNANITNSGETTKINWTLDIKVADDTIYVNLSALDLTGSDELAMVGVMIGWLKDQWLSIPATGLSDMPDTLSYLKDSKELNAKAKEIINNEWSVVYSWKFSQFNWYNAWKISIDNDKLNELIKEFYNTSSESESEETAEETPKLNIQNFEGYFVITWKHKVTTVIENMEIVENESTMTANWFAWDDYEINLYNGEEDLITITAQKKLSKYEISANIAKSIYLNWSISPKLSKSEINLKFDATLTIKSEIEWNPDTIIPFKGSWNYKPISDFSVTVPQDAKDLTELLGSFLGGTTLDNEYYAEDIENSLISEENTEEVSEEVNENSETPVEENKTDTEAE